MQYLMLLYQSGERSAPDSPEGGKVRAAMRAYLEDLERRGFLRGAAPLQPPQTATTVRERDGQRLLVDGPFMETKEWLAGYFLVDCPDLDTALELAADCPGCAGPGAVEVRPLAALPEAAPTGGVGGAA
jgi:hypothetical protein